MITLYALWPFIRLSGIFRIYFDGLLKFSMDEMVNAHAGLMYLIAGNVQFPLSWREAAVGGKGDRNIRILVGIIRTGVHDQKITILQKAVVLAVMQEGVILLRADDSGKSKLLSSLFFSRQTHKVRPPLAHTRFAGPIS